ncbi:MAG: ATPase domain-containing protein [Candidatus Thermoplasmatota archaeon]
MAGTARVPTGIHGFDELIGGGLPERSVSLVSGPAGSAKSLLAMQFIYNGVKDYGEPGIFITLEESRDNILRAMSSYGIEIERYEKDGKLVLLDMGEIRRRCNLAEDVAVVGFEALSDLLDNLLNLTRAKRLSLDSLTAVGLHYEDSPGILRRELFKFASILREKEVTSLLVTESIEGGALTRYGIEQFIADAFVVLGLEEVKGELRRTLTVRKMRFTKHDTTKHPILIGPAGINVSAESKVF